jgi:protein-disulfide isomerase
VEAIVFADFGCPYCAMAWVRIRELPLRLCFRHFPMSAKHPRAPALHAAAEAAGHQGAFWEMCDSLYEDRGRVDDPHLWGRVERFGLDLERFERDRRSDAVAERVRRDFESGIRAGVAGTPTAFVEGRQIQDQVADRLAEIA